jgi:Fe-S cluster assembly protein SufD
MTAILTATQDTANESMVLDLHKKYLEEIKPPQPFRELNSVGAERFELLKLPHSKHEMYTFVNTKELSSVRFDLPGKGGVESDFIKKHIYPACDDNVIVMLDGVFRPDLSNTSNLDSRIKVTDLAKALDNHQAKQYLLDTIRAENDVFASINSAFFHQGIYLEVEHAAQANLQILCVSSGSSSNPVMTTPRILAKVGRNAEIGVVLKYVGAKGNYFVNAVQDFILEENSKVIYTQIQADDRTARHFSKTRIQMSANSRFLAANASFGSKLVRHHYEAHLKGNGAELLLNALSILRGEDQVHNFVRVHHEAPHCVSNQHFKNIVNDKTRSSFDGTVIVCKGAQLTSSDQLINNLQLSDDAHADSKPNLMIFADDVKCTHGSTVGRLNDEQLFYLNSRCLSLDAAKTLLTRSFAESILETIQFPDVVNDLRKTLLKKLEPDYV